MKAWVLIVRRYIERLISPIVLCTWKWQELQSSHLHYDQQHPLAISHLLTRCSDIAAHHIWIFSLITPPLFHTDYLRAFLSEFNGWNWKLCKRYCVCLIAIRRFVYWKLGVEFVFGWIWDADYLGDEFWGYCYCLELLLAGGIDMKD